MRASRLHGMVKATSRVILAGASLLFAGACTRGSPPAVASTDAAPPTRAASTAATPPEIAADERGRLVAEIGRQLEAHYVFPDVGARMAAALRDRALRRDYDGITTAADLAHTITDDMRAVSHDQHAMLERTPSPETASADEEERARTRAENRATSGFGPAERLPGNVAHLVLRSFEPGVARDVVAKRMTEVADADALILDLRDNHGGDPATVALVASYVFDAAPVHLNDMFWRDDGSTDAYFTLADVPGKRFGASKPLFVLTSQVTFSAAEEFAYDVQCLHRATIVGETTRGGAHPVAVVKLSPLLTLRVPTGRAINPVTKTNWEGTGVNPDVPAAASDAVRVAHALALRAIAASQQVAR